MALPLLEIKVGNDLRDLIQIHQDERKTKKTSRTFKLDTKIIA